MGVLLIAARRASVLFCLLTAMALQAEVFSGSPAHHFIARIDPKEETIDGLKELAATYAREEGFTLFTEQPEEMAFITRGLPAFASYLYLNGDPVITLSNAGLGDTLTVYAFNVDAMNGNELAEAVDRLIELISKMHCVSRVN